MNIIEWILYILEVIGLWMLFEKCGVAGWKSLIPFYNTYCLGECAHDEEDGKWAAICTLLAAIFGGIATREIHAGLFSILQLMLQLPFGLIGAIFAIAELVFMIRIYAALIARFERPKWWLLIWIFFDGIAAIVWGFLKEYEPKDGFIN